MFPLYAIALVVVMVAPVQEREVKKLENLKHLQQRLFYRTQRGRPTAIVLDSWTTATEAISSRQDEVEPDPRARLFVWPKHVHCGAWPVVDCRPG